MTSKQLLPRRFFKVMMPGFRSKLNLPPAFCRKLNNIVTLTSKKGTWKIHVGVCSKGIVSFNKGWEKFVSDHCLNIGDFVVFEYIDDMHFDVLVLDSFTACEKAFPTNLVSDIDGTPGAGGVICDKVFTNVKKLEESDEVPAGVNLDGHGEPVKGESATEASECHGNPHFVATMQPHNSVSLNIPVEFMKAVNLSKMTTIILSDPSSLRRWPIKLRYYCKGRKQRAHMGKGFSEFYKSNRLRPKDVCHFQLISTRSATAVMEVKVFPAKPNKL